MFGSCNVHPEAIIELHWLARVPLESPGGTGRDGYTQRCAYNHSDAPRKLAQPPINTQTCCWQLAHSLCSAAATCILKPALSFTGWRGCRWKALEAPVVTDKLSGALTITTTHRGSLRNHLSTQKPAVGKLAHSLCSAAATCILKPSLSFTGWRGCRWKALEVPVVTDTLSGALTITATHRGSLRNHLSTHKPAVGNSLTRCVRQLQRAS